MHPRLVENDMREFRQPVLDVLNPAAADDVLGLPSSGFQNVVSVIQHASFSTRSLKPKAWNISMVRQAMPSAWPSSNRPGFCSTMQVLMSGNAASCAASVKPAGPPPTIRTSTSPEPTRMRPRRRSAPQGRRFRDRPARTVEMKLHETCSSRFRRSLWILLSMLIISILVNSRA